MSLSAEGIANETLKQILSKLSFLPLKPFRIPRCIILLTHDRTRSQLHNTWVTHVMQMRMIRGTFVLNLRGNSFHYDYQYPLTPSSLPLLRSTSLSRSSFSNPSAAATPSSPVRKSFTASTSSPPYSRRPRKSSLRRRRSRLPPPS